MTNRARLIALAHLAWIAVGIFWYFITRNSHPTTELAIIVTASLVAASAVVTDINLFELIPWYWRPHRFGTYAFALLGTIAALTALALAVIRLSYFHRLGPDPDPHGLYKHFAIDLCGIAAHVMLASAVVWAWGKVTRLTRDGQKRRQGHA